MNSDNWQDRLAVLKASMPADADPEPQPEPASAAAKPAKKETLEVFFERKGRGGKVATIITGFAGTDDELADIASRLKKSLGTGGSARGGEILIQGDRRAAVASWLRAQGYKVK